MQVFLEMLSVLIVNVLDWKKSCLKFASILKIKGNLSTKRGAPNRGTNLEKCTKIAVWRNDITPVDVWQSEVGSLVQKLEVAEDHVEEWKQKYADIENEKEVLFLGMFDEKELNSACQEECDNMKKYIRQLRRISQVRGIGIPKLKSTQAQIRN